MNDVLRGAVRAARADDFDAIIGLYRQLQPNDPVLSYGEDRVVFASILSAPWLTLFVLEVDGVVVATTYLNVVLNMTRSASPYAVIENVVVDEGHRGTGLGKLIMAATLDAAWAAGCYKAMLLTGSKSPSTHAFYRACGFSPDEKTAYLARPTIRS
ncbi:MULTISPECIES: GNAT family N-acetyltransferase [unclassified Microbacterium]|uniref:GNAT family N-acetyltransferase n=1 Tax=unclassified Microbacterium TaxID=2609290 RepID=UPI0012FC3F2E|nr:GNAT family N-acetyltransferase [Microbacterium sp. MAH-37]MVQ43000.1 GNAT family N-acetyltransferase [Microbacterium sp. MAH-37]